MKPLPNSMPSRPAPRKPANMPPRKPGRLKKPPAGDVVRRALSERAARLAGLGHAALDRSRAAATLRSMAARRRSASHGCRSCRRVQRGHRRRSRRMPAPQPARKTRSNGRKLKRDIDSSQETIRFDLTYWGPMTAFKEVPHGVADGLRSRRRKRFGQIHGGTQAAYTAATLFGQFHGTPGSKRQRERGF